MEVGIAFAGIVLGWLLGVGWQIPRTAWEAYNAVVLRLLRDDEARAVIFAYDARGAEYPLEGWRSSTRARERLRDPPPELDEQIERAEASFVAHLGNHSVAIKAAIDLLWNAAFVKRWARRRRSR